MQITKYTAPEIVITNNRAVRMKIVIMSLDFEGLKVPVFLLILLQTLVARTGKLPSVFK